MTIKTLLAAAVLMATPVLASAQCMWGEHGRHDATINCADGTVWDASAMACVAGVSS